MIEFDVDMGYLLECDELDKVVLNDEDGEYEPMEFIPKDAATVGRGNLTAEQVREAIMSADRWRKPMGNTGMTNTHLIIRDDGWQAIADELNATVGAGTCKLVIEKRRRHGPLIYHFGCGYDFWQPTDCPMPILKHCPNCGAQIIKEAAE